MDHVKVHRLDPLSDLRWQDFVNHTPGASVFHTPGWLDALRRTYGFTPAVYTTSHPEMPVTNGLVLCEVESRLTGRRLVSIPFADHCEPLFEADCDRDAVLGALQLDVRNRHWKYLEIRPLTRQLRAEDRADFDCFYFHNLDLRPSLDAIFGRFHKDSIQRKIRRAEREALRCDVGRSEPLLAAFFGLLVQTRRRHGLPPQPIAWFRNLIDCLGDRVNILVAWKHTRPLAAMLTLRHRDTLVYKYGASDAILHSSGAMPFLFWNVIRQAKSSGIAQIDLGRSDIDQAGLITFKDRLGAERSSLTYQRYPTCSAKRHASGGSRAAKLVLTFLPDWLLEAAGRRLYRHVG